MNDIFIPGSPAGMDPDGLPVPPRRLDGEPIRSLRDLRLDVNVRWAVAKRASVEVCAVDDGADEVGKVFARRDALFEVALLLDVCTEVTDAITRLVEMTAAVVSVRATAEPQTLELTRAVEFEGVYEDVLETLRGLRGAS